MALLNNIYIFVETEDIDESVEIVTHPVESNEIPTTSAIRKQPISIGLHGYFVDTEAMTAQEAISKVRELHQKGSLIDYVGAAGSFSNYQIESFPKSFSNKNNGGASFDITLKQVRIVKNTASTKPKTVKTVKSPPEVGDRVLFLGGYVYYASDSTSPSAKREKSECELTKISTLSNRKHIYHLISQDCKYGSPSYVYGWVDADRVQCIEEVTNASSNGGKQQTSNNEKPKTYKMKKGDTVWGIVNRIFPSWGFSEKNIIENNPHAFSTAGDPTTLQIGATLKLC